MFQYGQHFYMLGILFFLVVGHFACDFALQNDYMSKAKDPTNPLGQNGVWKWVLIAHASIHAGMVAYFSHSLVLGVFEGISHAIIDYLKCRKVLTYHQDQCLHLALKVLWAILASMHYA